MTHIHAPNQSMDNEGLTESNSLTHLLNTYDTENDEEINILSHSKYYSTTEFGDILKAKAGFSLLSLNIQSVASKFSKLETFLDKIEQNSRNPISVIAMQECGLDDSKLN